MGYGPRPMGVTILAVLSGLMALVSLLAVFGALLVLTFAGNSEFIQALNDSGAPQWIIDNFQAIFTVLLLVFLIFIVVYSLLAYGFMMGSRWAWTLGICFAVINIAWTVFGLIFLQGTSGLLNAAINILIPAIILYYLVQSNVRSYFLGDGQVAQLPYESQL